MSGPRPPEFARLRRTPVFVPGAPAILDDLGMFAGFCVGPGGRLIAVGDPFASAGRILTSDDEGRSWVPRTHPKNISLFAVAYAPALGQIVAIGINDGADTYCVTSADGTSWAEQATPNNEQIYDITSSDSLFVAVGQWNGDAYVLTSPTGVTWTERVTPGPGTPNLTTVAWSRRAGMFVAGGGYLLSSPDGITWTERTTPAGATGNIVVLGRDRFYNLAFSAGLPVTMQSVDGITWTELPSNIISALRRSNATFDVLQNIAWDGKSTFVGSSQVQTGVVYVSTDFATWTRVRAPVSNNGTVCWTGSFRTSPDVQFTTRGRFVIAKIEPYAGNFVAGAAFSTIRSTLR